MSALLTGNLQPQTPPDPTNGDDAIGQSRGSWLLGAAIIVASVFARAGADSNREATIAAVVASVALAIGLVPWLWAGWLERRQRWSRSFRLLAVALGLLAASQILVVLIDVEQTAESLAPNWVQLIRLSGLFAAAFATLRLTTHGSRRTNWTRALAIPALGSGLVTIALLVVIDAVADPALANEASDWLIAIGLIATPAFIAIAHIRAGTRPSADSNIPHAMLAFGWLALSAASTGVAADTLLQRQTVTPRTDWALLPAIAFLTAGAMSLLNERLDYCAHTKGVLPRPSSIWARALVPSVMAAAATTVAVTLLVDSPGFATAIVAAIVLCVALAIVSQQAVNYVRLSRAAIRLEQTRRELALQATVDPVTALPNRRALDTRLEEEVERALRYQQPLSLCFVDIDHFKQVSDTLGHPTGDTVLREVGALIRKTARGIDFVGRYGGEEFVILLPGTWSADAAILGNRLRKVVATHAFNANGPRPARLTISIGIAGLPEHADSGEALRERADQALYRAKADGRDRVVIHEPDGA